MARARTPEDVKRVPLNMRTTQATRTKLDDAAKASGRSLAQEVEIRLERSFDFGDILNQVRDTALGLAEQQMEGLFRLAGGRSNFAVAMVLAYAMTIEAAEAGGEWEKNENVRHKVEARLLSMIPGLLRNPPPPWGEPGPYAAGLAKLRDIPPPATYLEKDIPEADEAGSKTTHAPEA